MPDIVAVTNAQERRVRGPLVTPEPGIAADVEKVPRAEFTLLRFAEFSAVCTPVIVVRTARESVPPIVAADIYPDTAVPVGTSSEGAMQV